MITLLAAAPATGTAPQGFLSPTGVEIAFVLFGLLTFGAALVTVTTKQLVHAALWLVVTLGGLAVEYLLLTAEFIAWVQVLIYVGSVVVLLLFGLMLTRAPIGRSDDADSRNRPLAAAVALLAAAGLVWVVTDAFRTTYIHLDGAHPQGTTAVTGAFLFRHWVLPFEALSVLLLAALVGAIVLSRRRDDGGTPPRKPKPRPRTGAARGAGTSRTGAGTFRTGTSRKAAGTSPTGTSPTGTSPTGTSPTGTSPTGTDTPPQAPRPEESR
ncbi:MULTISPECIES: NADH-quinone oxidoreductase subunit J [Streptomyces]|uniref:NADH-quinone oxidoreductase subunit J n=1 Tax=Streptomyces evansiae TaxID=3075535 RepID=A0ABU2QSZ1_9ACTN|nr:MULTISPECIES: NADH-quinone oxidoreductase subunit J [unclassified Streptomyces]MDT0407543.1 NADH-quinone oxidoreductase subunit J [Streptomyces sp. DSM 41979]MYQ61043.1 hydroxyacid dehydrogenase [Streptomyces sp. SID4926]SCE56062.1 NADH-quinone oxidoreductase subunit J [Streptomyces sp. DfronAA-171]